MAMSRVIEDWLGDLATRVAGARASEEFQDWLDMQSRFHDYSARNTLLIMQQRPQATMVAGYRTWQSEFDRYVEADEEAIWIWAPIIARRCPECEHSQSYHEASDCDYDETAYENWSKGLVGFKPAPVFDVSQTAGEPIPELETGARGETNGLLSNVLEAAVALDIEVRVLPGTEWRYGDADGICRHQEGSDVRAVVLAKARSNEAALIGVLLHEYAHAFLHAGGLHLDERSKREVEAEAVAYVVGRYFGLDTSNSAFYLAAWQGEDVDVLRARLGRISSTSARLIEAIES